MKKPKKEKQRHIFCFENYTAYCEKKNLMMNKTFCKFVAEGWELEIFFEVTEQIIKTVQGKKNLSNWIFF